MSDGGSDRMVVERKRVASHGAATHEREDARGAVAFPRQGGAGHRDVSQQRTSGQQAHAPLMPAPRTSPDLASRTVEDPTQAASGEISAAAVIPVQRVSSASAVSTHTGSGEGTTDRTSRSALSSLICRHGLVIEFVASLAGGAVAGFAGRPYPVAVVTALSLWAVANFHRGRMLTSPLIRQLQSVLHSMLLPIAGIGFLVGFAHTRAAAIVPVFAAVLTASAISIAIRLVRWRLRVPVRTVLVGDRLAIAQAAAQWARTPDVVLVGALLLEPDLDDADVPHELLGSPVEAGIDDAAAHVQRWGADVVLVAHGPGLTTVDFRRLAWKLEDSAVSLGVVGLLDSVAPHRITPGQLDRATVMDVRAPKPSGWVRAGKAGLDRAGAGLLLLLTSPVLLGSIAALKLDSKGPALFKQVRVGLHGEPFKVYKLRTMIADAEAAKAALLAANEYDGVLFKMKEDPRITRVGRILRKLSLDELPQLINVLKGDMSLVGPRPHLPNEIAAMDADTLRRLAVRPGITGLWQVSGRSNLPSGMASELDTYYADNWSLTGDVSIALRTVKAVATAEGAY